MKLDLGSGPSPREGFDGVDRIAVGRVRWKVDLAAGAPWPWETSSVEELYSSHFIEHIDARNVLNQRTGDLQDALLFFFDEAWRVAKPGALFTLEWPALRSDNAFRDPTHRRFIPVEMTHYLNRVGRKVMSIEHYPAECDWKLIAANVHMHKPPAGIEQWSLENVVTGWGVHDSYHVVLEAVK